MSIDGIKPGQRHHPGSRREGLRPVGRGAGVHMWWLILAALWVPLIGAVCAVVWWPRIRAWLGAPPQEMTEDDWVELVAAMNRYPAGKSQPGDAVQIMAPMTIGPGGIIITPEEEPR